MSQTFFSMGAVKCLIDNNLFNFDVISAVSGGTILLLFIEACHVYNLIQDKDWYNKYLRDAIYKLNELGILQTLIRTKFNFDEFTKIVNKLIPAFNKPLNKYSGNIKFEYNYFDVASKTISNDHDDIFKNKKYATTWNYIQTIRCCVPITNFNNKFTYDAAALENTFIDSVITYYEAKQITIINSGPYVKYNKYNQPSLLDAIIQSPLFISSGSNTETMDTAAQILKNKPVYYCSMSNYLYKSKDKYHKNVFYNYSEDYNTNNRFYLGVFFKNTDVSKILENEGYIQMYHELKSNGYKKLKFKIPNKEVYNNNVSKIMSEFHNQNIFLQFLKDFVNYNVKV